MGHPPCALCSACSQRQPEQLSNSSTSSLCSWRTWLASHQHHAKPKPHHGLSSPRINGHLPRRKIAFMHDVCESSNHHPSFVHRDIYHPFATPGLHLILPPQPLTFISLKTFNIPIFIPPGAVVRSWSCSESVRLRRPHSSTGLQSVLCNLSGIMSILWYKRPDYVTKVPGPMNLTQCQIYVERTQKHKRAIPPELSFENVIQNKALPPCALQDFMVGTFLQNRTTWRRLSDADSWA